MEDTPNEVLGLCWNPSSDEFAISLPKLIPSETPSKRKALSLLAQMFDPIRYLSPFIVVGNIFMQKVWLSKLSWDEPLTPELAQEW